MKNSKALRILEILINQKSSKISLFTIHYSPIHYSRIHVYDFPAYREKILTLEQQSNRFRKLSEAYHETDKHIYRIEEGAEATTDEHLNELRMKRVHLKDELYKMLL